MSWQPSQVATIIMEYAHNGVAYCPHDHTRLVTLIEQLSNSKNLVIVHRCPSCGNDTSSALQPSLVSKITRQPLLVS